MKKILSAVLAIMMLAALGCAAALAEDEIPQPEGGKKFESDWAKMDGLVSICYEEEGYRVRVDLYNEADRTGSIWEYSCYYSEELDALQSVSAVKHPYTVDPDTQERVDGENVYEGLDEEGQTTVFSINQDGRLIWADGRGNEGADLEFRNIGRYEGVWRNDGEEVAVRFRWEGLRDEESFFYTATIRRGNDEFYVEFTMKGLPDPETGRLAMTGTAVSFTRDADGNYRPEEDGETYEAFFSVLENGKILFEAANGIELEYDLLGEFPNADNG